MLKSPATVCYEILDKARMRVAEFPDGMSLRVHPEVARAMRGHEAPILDELKRMLGNKVEIRGSNSLHQEQFELNAIQRGGGSNQRSKAKAGNREAPPQP